MLVYHHLIVADTPKANAATMIRSSSSGYHASSLPLVVVAVQDDSSHRELTYLNTDSDDAFVSAFDGGIEDTLLLTFFSLLAVSFLLIAYFTVRIIYNTKEFQQHAALKYSLPAVSIYLALECATLAVDQAIRTIPSPWATILYFMEAMIVAPGLLLSTFMITFVAYRIRSMPFCCVRRRSDVEADNERAGVVDVAATEEEPLVQPAILVLTMHAFAVLLFIFGVSINFDILWSSSDANLAGRTGWLTLVLEPWNQDLFHVALALIPMTLVCGVCYYFAGLLFRYGNTFSMTIYSSFLNPWMWPLMGVTAMLGGFLPTNPWFPLTSNLGICLYQVAILRVLFEIRQDLGQATELGSYLRACWEAPQALDVVTTTVLDGISEPPTSPLSADRTGILRGTLSSSKKGGGVDTTELPDAAIL